MADFSLGVVVGMTAEARLLRGIDCAVAIGGGTPLGARRMARALISDGAKALISFGLAGGLDPALPAGALVLPAAVLTGHGTFACDAALRADLAGEPAASLLAAEVAVSESSEKLRLWRETGAAVTDLESGAVAEVAAAAGIPFAVLRAVCDPATRNLPRAAVEALDAQGRIVAGRMAAILARHPSEIFGLLCLARDAYRGRKALVRGAESLGRLAAGDADLRRLAS